MDVVRCFNARLLRARMDLLGKIKKRELYGHDDLDPQGSDRHILIREINESLFVYPYPLRPPPGSVNRTSVR